MIDQNVPYQPGGDGHEVHPVLPIYVSLVYQPDIGLVHQSRGLQGVAGPLPAQCSDARYGAFHQRNEPVQAILIPLPPSKEELRHRL
jgi:hypothetical protein